VRVVICVCALVVSTACSNSPTAPTQPGAVAGQLRWDVVSASCAPVVAPSPQPEFSSATITMAPNGTVTASWPYLENGRSVTLYAHFVRENGAWAMCSWDTVDV
jgi:hypothetical protein